MSGPPQLPERVSSNGEEIWGWAHALSEWTHRQHKIRELRADIAQVVCGDCQIWMTRQCPRERNVNGRNHGPSMYGAICGQFSEKLRTTQLRDKRRAELAELLARDSGRLPKGEDSRSEAECEASQSGDCEAGASPNLPDLSNSHD